MKSPSRVPLGFPTLLAMAVVAVNLFVIAIVVFSLRQSRDQYRLHARITTRNLCQVLEQNLVGIINEINLALLSVKDEAERQIAAGGIQKKALNGLIERQAERIPAIHNLRLAEAQGGVIYGAHQPSSTKINIADREYFRKLRDDPKAELVTTAPLVGLQDGKRLILFARRVNRADGSFAGIAYATVGLDQFTRSLSLVDVGGHGVITFRAGDNSLLARYPISAGAEAGFGQRRVSRELQTLLDSGRSEATYRAPSGLDEQIRTFSFRRIPDYPFIVVVGLAEEDYLADWRHQATSMAVLLGVFGLYTLLAWLGIYQVWKRRLSAQAENTRLARIVESSGDAIFSLSLDGRITSWNQGAEKLHGYTAAEAIGQPLELLVPAEPADLRREAKERIKSRTPVEPFETVGVRKDGSQVDVTVGLSPLTDGRGNLIGCSAIVRDITTEKRAEEQLKRTAARLQLILDKAPVGIVIANQRNRFEETNAAFQQMTGLSADELRQMGMEDLTHPDDKDQSIVLADGLRNGSLSGYDFEKRYLIKNGKTIWIRVIGTRLDERHRISMIEDITERKRAEEALRESQEKYRNLFDTLMEGFCIIEVLFDRDNRPVDYRFLEGNPAFEKLTGFRGVQGRLISELLPQVEQHWIEAYGRAALTGEPMHFENEVKALGSWFEVFAYRIGGEKSRQVAVLFSNISERKRAELELSESRQQLQAAMDGARLGTWKRNLRTGEITWDRQARAMFGVAPDEIVTHQKLVGLIAPEHRVAFERLVRERYQSDGSDLGIEYRIIRPDGSIRWIHSLGGTRPNASGRADALIGVFVDITERKRTEEERERLREQLAQAQKMESIGRLAGGVAHDFNNLLTVIGSYTEMLRDSLPLHSPLRKNTRAITTAVERAASLTAQMLAFSRKQIIDPVVLDLNEVIQETSKMIRRLIGEDIELRVTPAASLRATQADSGQMVQVLMNLCVNARDAMPQGGTLTIRTENVTVAAEGGRPKPFVAPGNYVELAVTDTGVGISRELQEKVFEPFFTTKEVGKGTGLGLATVYGIVKQSGGYVWVDSEPGQGACFTALFPAIDKPVASAESAHAEKALRGTETLLLVEDEESLREAVGSYLEGLGYTVLAANSGHQALDLFQEHDGHIDLLITDVIMPRMSGRELADMLSSLDPALKTLYMSGYTDEIVSRQGLRETGAHFLQKPFSLSKLAARVREALKSTQVVH